MKTIEITVSKDGQAKVETTGFAGSECRAASQFVERALGRMSSERFTEEFYQPVAKEQTLQEGARG